MRAQSRDGRHDAGSAARPAVRHSELVDRGRKVLEAAAHLTGPEHAAVPDAMHDLAALDDRLAVLTSALRERLVSRSALADGLEAVGLGTSLADALDVRHEIHDHLSHERLRRLDAVEAGLSPLRKLRHPEELLNRACETVLNSCGFDRVMLSRVEGSVWRPWKSRAVTDREPERAFREWMRGVPEIQLDHLTLESEMVRCHRPALVTDGEHDPRVHRPLLEASGLRSYVAAPLMPAGRVIGFLHADHASAPVTSLDLDVLWAFTRAFGQLFERTVLLARLGEQRAKVQAAMETLGNVLGDLASAEIELIPRASATASDSRTDRPPVHSSSAALESLLTPRELEVLSLMATGATNDRIAEQLVISNGTVKSHVKRILRKLRAENRGEAIYDYLHLTITDS
ncbi:LuxR C-terminal-related transcriptional regulator [Streptomyces sp. NPDC057621]|uniref:LuxR C-terminal-related transcriptional regulator n=1 Tax=Streptomyces sp. NPDC057621 TaxID=3346186 RepID=UPI0036C22A18